MKPNYHFDIIQNSEEWDIIRLGKFTASSCSDLMMDVKTKGYQGLIAKVFEERFTGEKCQSKMFAGNAFTDRGHEFEPIAISEFEMESFFDVVTVGFVSLDDWVGCSPDGLIGENGLVQVKCPIFSTQLSYLELVEQHKGLNANDLLKKIDGSYYKQMQFELYVTQRDFNHFYSYHPKLPSINIKIERDEEMIAEIENRINVAKAIITGKINKLRNLK